MTDVLTTRSAAGAGHAPGSTLPTATTATATVTTATTTSEDD
jgi:hypothetical protein